MYLIIKKLLQGNDRYKEKSAMLALVSSLTLSSINNVIYIRMYALSTLNIAITTYLHLKLLDKEENNYKLLLAIGIFALIGSLTHYYYLFYLAMLFVMFVIKYLKEKEYKELGKYVGIIALAGIISLIIFPYSIQHMFFGYRGQGAISNLKNIKEILPNLFTQIQNLNYYGFNTLLPIIFIIIIGVLIYNYKNKTKHLILRNEEKEILKIISIPSIFFFIITSITCPWRVLRYFVPACGLLFVLVMYCFYKVLQAVFNEKTTNILTSIFLCVLLIVPIIFKLEPELWYRDRKEIVEELNGEFNLPTIYLYNSQNSIFLDDILLFSIIDESYVARDMDCTEENIQKIFENKDIKKGIIVFINKGQDNEKLLNTVKMSLNFNNFEHLKKLNSADVYYISN